MAPLSKVIHISLFPFGSERLTIDVTMSRCHLTEVDDLRFGNLFPINCHASLCVLFSRSVIDLVIPFSLASSDLEILRVCATGITNSTFGVAERQRAPLPTTPCDPEELFLPRRRQCVAPISCSRARKESIVCFYDRRLPSNPSPEVKHAA